MEDVLEVYHRPVDPRRPVVCMDETNRQLIGEVRPVLSARPGRVARCDGEYVRHGTANLFLAFEPLAGWREVTVTERRRRTDWAAFMQGLLDGRYADAEQVVMVMDQLNTHRVASFYEAFDPVEARRLIERLEIHYTPKHGSWLNMAEIELSVLQRQCLDRRIADAETLRRETQAWSGRRNQTQAQIDWRLTTDEARIKLKKLYPSFNA